MLKLLSAGLRPWFEYTLNPADWSHTRRKLGAHPASTAGFAGLAQELKVAGRGTMMFAVFVHAGDIVLLLGSEVLSLFTPGLRIEHVRGSFKSELRITTPAGKSASYRYRHIDLLLEIVDPAYDDLDFELAHLPALLPSLAQRRKEELVAEWAARAALAPAAPR